MIPKIKRRTIEKELRMSRDYVFDKKTYEEIGATYVGTVGKAAKDGYFSAATCARISRPVTEEEFRHIKYFAMMMDCYADQCILDADGHRCRPCIPVFWRGEGWS